MITKKLEKEFCYCCFFKQNIVFSFVSIDVSFYTFYICLMYHFKKKNVNLTKKALIQKYRNAQCTKKNFGSKSGYF